MIDNTATRTVLVEGVKADDLLSRLTTAAEEMPVLSVGYMPPLDSPEQHFRRIRASICNKNIPKYWSDDIVEKFYLDSGRILYPKTIRSCNDLDRTLGMRGDLGDGGRVHLEILEPRDEDDFIVIHLESHDWDQKLETHGIRYEKALGYQTVAAHVGSIVPYDLEPGFSPLDFDALIEQLGGRMYCLDDCFENAIGKKQLIQPYLAKSAQIH